MIPSKDSPQWVLFIDRLGTVPVGNLAARMLMTRLKMKLNFEKNSPEARQQCIAEAHSFFVQNENNIQSDIKLIFG